MCLRLPLRTWWEATLIIPEVEGPRGLSDTRIFRHVLHLFRI